MKILLSDEVPDKHFRTDVVGEFAGRGLVWHNPREGDAALEGFDAVILHASDEKKYGLGVGDRAAKHGIPLILYSGARGIAFDLENELRAKYSPLFLTTTLVGDIPKSLKLALDNRDVSFLKWDRLSDALELLTTFWAIGLTWEMEGAPYALASADGALRLAGGAAAEGAGKSLLGPEGTLERSCFSRLRTTDGRKVIDLLQRIYDSSPDKPDVDETSLIVRSIDAYNDALGNLRDSLLGWARGRR